MPFDTITVKRDDQIATVTLNRPERLNAMNPRMFDELVTALDDLEKDSEVRVLIITGAGKAFSAGADFTKDESGSRVLREKHPEAIRQNLRKSQRVIKRLQSLGKPIIAMVNGVAVGGGFDLALACDLRVGSDKARFKAAFTKLGLVPGTGGAWLLPRVIGLPRAAEVLFTGDFIEPKEAERMGILSKLVPGERLELETMTLARKIACNPPICLGLDKLLLYKGLEVDLDTALEMAASSQTICSSSEDHKEGIAAAREKRTPVFKGR